MFRISEFCHFVEVDDVTDALYNSLTLGVLFLNKTVSNVLRHATGDIFDENQIAIHEHERSELLQALLERRLIFPLGNRGDLEDYLKMQVLLQEGGLAILYLLLTDNCNLGCKYCYIENAIPSGHKFSLMSEEIAFQGLDIFAANLSLHIAEPNVILYGGEPLMNKPVLFAVAKKFQAMKESGKLPSKTNLGINTNATLVDETFIAGIKGTGAQLSVSVDGTKEMHDAMRVYRNGNGTFDTVIKKCEMLTEAGVDFGFSVTMTAANLDRLEEVLLWLHEKFAISSVGFNIAIHKDEKSLGMDSDKYAALMAAKLISCFKICRQKGIFEDRMMRKVNAFVKGYPYLYDCGAPGDQIVVTPDGYVGVCQAYCAEKKYFIPIAEAQKPLEHPIWQEWKFRSPVHQKQCFNCIALAICGGGCPYCAELQSGSIWEVDKTFCVHAKTTTEFLIRDLFQQTKA